MSVQTIKVPCPSCDTVTYISVLTKQIEAWTKHGELFNVAFPTMSSYQKAAILTGYCADCQEQGAFEENHERLKAV